MLAYNVYTGWQYLTSGDNVSDDPTRERECREPLQDVPSWLSKALEGDFEEMDRFLAEQGVDEATLAQLPEMKKPAAIPTFEDPPHLQRRRLWRQSRSGRTGLGLSSVKSPVVAPRFRAAPWMPTAQLSATAQRLLRAVPRGQFIFSIWQ